MSAEHARKRRNRILSWTINLVGLLILLLILYLGGVRAWQQVIKADMRYLLAALAATAAWNLLAAFRWSRLAGQVTAEPGGCPYRYFATFHMLGMLMGQVLPISVGVLGARPVALSLSRGVSLRRAALSVFLDKLFDPILAVLFVGPVACYLVGWIDLWSTFGLMAGLAVLGALAVLWRYEAGIRGLGRIASRLSRPLGRLPVIGPRLMLRLPQQLDRLATESFVSNRLAAQSFLLTVLMYALLSLRMVLVSEALRLEIPWYLLVMGTCVTQLTLIFSFTPGSLGFLEGGWAAVLGLAGLSSEQMLVFLIGRRAFVLLLTAICTFLAFAWIRESPARLFRKVVAASRRAGPEAEAVADK